MSGGIFAGFYVRGQRHGWALVWYRGADCEAREYERGSVVSRQPSATFSTWESSPAAARLEELKATQYGVSGATLESTDDGQQQDS